MEREAPGMVFDKIKTEQKNKCQQLKPTSILAVYSIIFSMDFRERRQWPNGSHERNQKKTIVFYTPGDYAGINITNQNGQGKK